ncbi:MAG TPA: M13 family metallopeptidase N-terminal domain-containing protein, partial [Bacteroidia bacterium]|nr:M13 family metallopeptidase N-terminal domain-containing protein [Bacteroidia bacterium]
MRSMKIIFSFFAVAILFTFCDGPAPQQTTGKDIFADKVDSTANPAQDFFQFANGKWLKNNPIPSTNASWGIGNKVQEEIYTSLRKINEDAAKTKATSGDLQQIGDFWATGMDSVKADKLG